MPQAPCQNPSSVFRRFSRSKAGPSPGDALRRQRWPHQVGLILGRRKASKAAACLPFPRGGPSHGPRQALPALEYPSISQCSPAGPLKDAGVATFQAIWLRVPESAQWTERSWQGASPREGTAQMAPPALQLCPVTPRPPLPQQLPGASLPQNSPGDITAGSISQTPVLWGWAGLESKLALKRTKHLRQFARNQPLRLTGSLQDRRGI